MRLERSELEVTSSDPRGGTLLRRARATGQGLICRATARDAGWQFLSFEALRFGAGEGIRRRGDDQEVLVLVLEGKATVLRAACSMRQYDKRPSRRQ